MIAARLDRAGHTIPSDGAGRRRPRAGRHGRAPGDRAGLRADVPAGGHRVPVHAAAGAVPQGAKVHKAPGARARTQARSSSGDVSIMETATKSEKSRTGQHREAAPSRSRPPPPTPTGAAAPRAPSRSSSWAWSPSWSLGGITVYRMMTAGREDTDDAQVTADMVPVGTRVAGAVAHVARQREPAGEEGRAAGRDRRADYAARVQQAEAELATAQAQATAAEAQVADRRGDVARADSPARGPRWRARRVGVGGAEAQLASARAALACARRRTRTRPSIDLDARAGAQDGQRDPAGAPRHRAGGGRFGARRGWRRRRRR